MSVAIIPARGGSKRIPRKNIKSFCGKPMISYSIKAAISSNCFERIIVSTDDYEIAEIARSYGAETPFIRPSNLSDDKTETIPVVQHALSYLEEQKFYSPTVCCIYATAPFISPESINKGAVLLNNDQDDFVLPVTSFASPIQRALKLKKNKKIEMMHPENYSARSQDLEEGYHDAGQFYWGKWSSWKKGESIFSKTTSAIILPRYQVQDIDTPEDWQRAELLFKALFK